MRTAQTTWVTSLDTGFLLSLFIKSCQLQKPALFLFVYIVFAQTQLSSADFRLCVCKSVCVCVTSIPKYAVFRANGPFKVPLQVDASCYFLLPRCRFKTTNPECAASLGQSIWQRAARAHTHTHTQADHKAGKGDKLEGKLRPLCFQKVLFYFFSFSRAEAPDWPTLSPRSRLFTAAASVTSGCQTSLYGLGPLMTLQQQFLCLCVFVLVC